MAIPLIDLEAELGEAIGAVRFLVSSGGGSTTTIVDTGLQDLFLTDTAMPTWWGRITAGVAQYETRRFNGTYTFSSGTATVSRAYGGTIAASIPWELWSINPVDIRAALRRAASLVYPRVFKRTITRDIIVNNILKNPIFSESSRLNSLFFDGARDADDVVTISDQAQIQDIMDGAGGTIECWVIANSDGEGDIGRIFSKGGVELQVVDESAGEVNIRFTSLRSSTAGVWSGPSRVLTIGRPHHVAVTYSTDGVVNNPSILIDGSKISQVETVIPVGTRTTDVGNDQLVGNRSAGDAAFDGNIWNFRMWNYIRSAQQIKDNMNVALVGNEPGLVAAYDMQEGAGNVLGDKTLFQNDGTVTEAAWQQLDAFTHWEESGGPTITVDSERVFYGKYSVKMVAGSSDGQYAQTPFANLADLSGNKIIAEVWAWTAAGTTARIRIDWGGGNTIINSDYHDGNSEWQELTVEGAMPSTATQVKVILETIASGTANFDLASLDIGTKTRYQMPDELQTVNFVSQQINASNPNGSYLPFAPYQIPIPRRILRIEGQAQLSIPDILADTVEVEGKHKDYLIAVAIRELYGTLAGRAPEGSVKEDFKDKQLEWKTNVLVMENDPKSGINMARPAETNFAWKTDRSHEEFDLVFTGVGTHLFSPVI